MPARILAYSATAGFRHDSIEASIEALKAKESVLDVKFDFTEDKSMFTDKNLSQYDAVLFLNNSGISMVYILGMNRRRKLMGVHQSLMIQGKLLCRII
jgi:hypothetical protein